MTTSAVSSTTPTESLFTGSQKEMGRDAFLQLLVAQLSNQDPMSPQDGHEFAAQLAQFSSVEQLTQISDTLGTHTQLLARLSQAIDALELPASPETDTGETDASDASTPSAGDTAEADGSAL